ncbi:MAG: FliM/FliN family flagellar motor switch protein [Phycisphaerae bacterium]
MSLNQSDIDSLLAAEADASPAAVAAPAKVARPPQSGEIRRILDLPVEVSVVLSSRDMPIRAILALTVGSILEFEEQFDSDLILNVADHPIGCGQAVKIGENFGLRITGIGSVRERIGAMGGG